MRLACILHIPYMNSGGVCQGINMLNLLERLTDSSRKVVIWAFFLLFFVGWLDYETGYEIALSFFYLAPVLLVVWKINLRGGLLFSFLSAIVWFLNDYWFIAHPYSAPVIPYWNAAVRFAFFAAFSVLSGRVRSLLSAERLHSKLKSSMIHTVSHEFNNSLTVLASGLFLLRETEPEETGAMRRKVLTAMEETRVQMSRYIKNILNEARMDAGRFKLECTRLVLRDIVKDCADSMREMISTKGLTLEIKLPEPPVFVYADQDALALIVSNLLANAVKYTPQSGRITISVLQQGAAPGAVVFSIADTGIGISLEELSRLTEEFYRTDEGRNAAAGFGLGLKITNELLTLHGSRLEVFSEKGKGSRFFFQLPALAAQP